MLIRTLLASSIRRCSQLRAASLRHLATKQVAGANGPLLMQIAVYPLRAKPKRPTPTFRSRIEEGRIGMEYRGCKSSPSLARVGTQVPA